MADQKIDSEMNGEEDFTQDVEAEQMNGNSEQIDGQQNGNAIGGHHQDNLGGRDDDRKLFVGGLSWETTEKELREHFGTFGEIESITVKTDPNTGRSRGFAFIVYTTTEAIDKVMNTAEHVINNKKVDPKKAKARHGKIFVGGLTTEISDDEIKNYFGQFGNIVDVEMPFDKQKNQRKGFCFITFDSEQVVNELLKTPKQKIANKEVDVKRATPKPENMMMMPMMMPMRGGMRGGRGGAGGNTRGGRGGGGGKVQSGYTQGWNNQGYYGSNYGGYSGYDSYSGYDYYGGYGNYGNYDYSGYGYGKYSYNPNQANNPSTYTSYNKQSNNFNNNH